jgi:hypothetical protein
VSFKKGLNLLHYRRNTIQLKWCPIATGCWNIILSLIFSTSRLTLSYTANMFILMTLYDFCLSPAQFCYIIVYIRKVERCVQIADRCAPWKISNDVQNLEWVLAPGSHYIASARIAHRTPLPTAFLLFCACVLRQLSSNVRCLHSNYLANAIL